VNIQKATESYEKWVGGRVRLVREDLEYKHEQMAASPFPFLRATFYRWVQLWAKECSEESRAPAVLAVGDLHVENFGTWRDAEGRLVWGVNDFDEAYPMAYTNDLLRLAVSAHLAADEDHLDLRGREACDAVLEGYRQGLESGGKPYVLAEDNKWLRETALGRLRDPVRFWKRMEKLEEFRGAVPPQAREELENALPEKGLPYARKRRVAGLGSLGHLRVVALAHWHGGWVAREVKALTPSACIWAEGGAKSEKLLYNDIIARARRVPDPFLRITDGLLVRRLAPDCSRIELASLPEDRDERQLLHAMGFETANIHWGTRAAVPGIVRDLKSRGNKWLQRAAKRMAEVVLKDWKNWRKG